MGSDSIALEESAILRGHTDRVRTGSSMIVCVTPFYAQSHAMDGNERKRIPLGVVMGYCCHGWLLRDKHLIESWYLLVPHVGTALP